MQEFRHEHQPTEKEVRISTAPTQRELQAKLNELQNQMQEEGFVETKRANIGRNDKCPCGSGKKFKKCHMEAAAVLNRGKKDEITRVK